MAGFRQSDERVLLDIGRGITINELTLTTPDGSSVQRQVVREPGAVAVVPLLGDGRAVLVRQYRAAIDAVVLEIPAGLRDVPGEDPAATAQRELIEEVGYRADSLELMTVYLTAVGLLDATVHVYLGTGLSPVPHDRHGPEEHAMTIVEVALDDVPQLIASGELRDAKSIIGLLLARERRDR
ncbi:MAG: NUDIX hydrolase [Acidobacteria bacterium]|nr:NUDIX hydrolase [Acidobacteriota bacterium]